MISYLILEEQKVIYIFFVKYEINKLFILFIVPYYKKRPSQAMQSDYRNIDQLFI